MQNAGWLLALASLLLCDIATAAVIKCSFTEPFMATAYDTSLNRMTVTYDVEKRQTIHDRVSMRQISPGTFEFRNASGQLLQRVKRSCRGSDGMSYRKYPYEAELIIEKLHGGCTSTGRKRC